MYDSPALSNLLTKIKQRSQNLNLHIDTMVEYTSNAVLVPLVIVDNKICLLFEVRAKTLKWQPGEICFPGGRIEPEETDFSFAALRECEEELGIPSEDILLLGALHPVISPIGAQVYPYLGLIKSLDKLNINLEEVDSVFTVPIDWLLQSIPQVGVSETATRTTDKFPHDLINSSYPTQWNVRNTYSVYFYEYDNHVIWGLTAHIMRSFLSSFKDLF